MTRDIIVSPSNSTTQADNMYHTAEEDEAQQRHMQEMFDKRRRRRESHNMVERRRRDNINERIQELCSLLPNHLLDTTSSSHGNIVAGSQRSPNMINKGTILKLSVEHIKELRDQVKHYQQRIRDLEQIVHHGKLIHHSQPSFNGSTLSSSMQYLDTDKQSL
ncbi:uncharacterized protein BX664DRAFT_333143 [Halteromyces radiatus]|uniref:uncharacterized protein n=1 Tax=Halteromyces radiatus TaxID=101107 RepID=UPI00221EF033|nr:uncharacterized protein BX664DRAFT_333143 [Halteromyces radiatus]KAI8089492.1 hypothetical protein BX664DRAFT_333143 [Halteromyces radiatus]